MHFKSDFIRILDHLSSEKTINSILNHFSNFFYLMCKTIFETIFAESRCFIVFIIDLLTMTGKHFKSNSRYFSRCFPFVFAECLQASTEINFVNFAFVLRNHDRLNVEFQLCVVFIAIKQGQIL